MEKMNEKHTSKTKVNEKLYAFTVVLYNIAEKLYGVYNQKYIVLHTVCLTWPRHVGVLYFYMCVYVFCVVS